MGIDRDGIAGFVPPGANAPAPEDFSSGCRKAASGEGVFRSHIHRNSFHGSAAAVGFVSDRRGNTGSKDGVAAVSKGNSAYAADQ